MTETRKLAAILVSDVVGYSRLAGADEEGVIARLRALRREVVDPTVTRHNGRVVKSTGDGVIAEFRSAVDAARAAVGVQTAMAERNAGTPDERRIVFRIGLHVGDVIEEADGDLMGDGVNIAARLEGASPPGGICLSEAAWWQVKSRLDLAATDLGEISLKNIAQAIRAYAWAPGQATAPPPPAPALALPDKPSIAVLPFQNMGGDPEQAYFADGVVEDIITALSRTRWLFVIARNSSFAYRGRAVDIRQVGRELGVRYVLEGSVRRAGNRLRITGQLAETETGAHVWADRFDGSLDDVFELQDSVATSVAGAIAPTLQEAEIRRSIARATTNPSAYDLYLRAQPQIRGWGREAAQTGLALLRQAIARDPGYGRALAGAAWCTAQLVSGGWADDPDTARREVAELARRAVEAGPDESEVLVLSAGALEVVGAEIGPLLAMVDHALTLDPSSAYGWFWSGFLRLFGGDPDLAAEHFNASLRLDPRTPLRPFHQTGLGACLFFQEKFDQAASLLEGSLRQVPTYVTTAWVLASCYAHMGRLDEARGVVERLRANGSPLIPANAAGFRDPARRDFFLAGLRRAVESLA